MFVSTHTHIYMYIYLHIYITLFMLVSVMGWISVEYEVLIALAGWLMFMMSYGAVCRRGHKALASTWKSLHSWNCVQLGQQN